MNEIKEEDGYERIKMTRKEFEKTNYHLNQYRKGLALEESHIEIIPESAARFQNVDGFRPIVINADLEGEEE